jgi:catechol 2,3-dioxygenase-like lactoylglutathione lyase family enzyme
MITVQAIDHVVLRTSDLQAMLRFYCDVLNCSPERELKDLGLVQLRAGDALIDIVPVDSDLGRVGGRPPSQDGRNMDHVCLRIGRMDEAELAGYLSGHGVAVQEFADRYGAQGHGRSLYIEDPEGNTVELKFAVE